MTLQAIQAALEAVLAALLPNTPIDWANTDFTQPSAEYVSSDGVSWCRPTFVPGMSFEDEIGITGYEVGRRTGVFIVQIFLPKDQGSGPALVAGAMLEAAYRRKDLSGVQTGEPYTNNVGEDAGQTSAEGASGALNLPSWYQVNVVVPWWAWIGEA